MNFAFFSKRDDDGVTAGIVTDVQDLPDREAACAARDDMGPFYSYIGADVRVLNVGDTVYPTKATPYDFHWRMPDGSAGDLIATMLWIAPTDSDPGAFWPLDISRGRVVYSPSVT